MIQVVFLLITRLLQIVICIVDHGGFKLWMKFRILYLTQHLVIAQLHVARKTRKLMILTQNMISVILK